MKPDGEPFPRGEHGATSYRLMVGVSEYAEADWNVAV
jgi:hypothetical protein